MENGNFFETTIKSAEELARDRKIQERVRSLRGMILKGGEQGEQAKKKLLKEFPDALGLVVEMEREARRNRK